ncbi:MAG: hypothetical protein K0R66_1101 [Gammaproteobacteria bacterium]|jgi:hypothetical protein|nr:hypothetical protein [Gammaproteobacteria bacterium]
MPDKSNRLKEVMLPEDKIRPPLSPALTLWQILDREPEGYIPILLPAGELRPQTPVSNSRPTAQHSSPPRDSRPFTPGQ